MMTTSPRPVVPPKRAASEHGLEHRGARSRPTRGARLTALLSHSSGALSLASAAPLTRHSAAEVSAWFTDDFLAPLQPASCLCGLLDASVPPGPLWRLSGRVPVSFVYREREGGRRYAFFAPGYHGPRLPTVREYRAMAGARLLLPAIPRAARSAFPAPPGHRYITVDVDRCFPTLLAAVAQDEELLAAVRQDLHQEAGDIMAPHMTRRARRQVGKLFNNAVVGLISPAGWHRELHRQGHHVPADEALRMHMRWWARFAGARRFRDAWERFQRHAAEHNRPLRIVYPDGRPYTFDAATVRGAARRPRWTGITEPAQRLNASIRTTFSAIWRGIEGAVLDQALHRLHKLRERGLRLVLPMYDGLLLQAPTDAADGLAGCARAELLAALHDVGIPATVTVTVCSTWGGDARRINQRKTEDYA